MIIVRNPDARQPDGRPIVRVPGAAEPPPVPAPVPVRELTSDQLTAIHAAMRRFLEDDLARGVLPEHRVACDACRRSRPLPGAIQYDRSMLCNACAIEYEVARARGLVSSAAQFVQKAVGSRQ